MLDLTETENVSSRFVFRILGDIESEENPVEISIVCV